MNLVYNLILHFVYFLLKIIALFNKKINLFIEGRKDSFSKLNTISKDDKVVWFHAASLGEFEQGRPIIENFKLLYPNYKIVLTFFSPSGYEIKKEYKHADVVCYLPFDTKRNMQNFIETVHPELAVIIKYEFWPNLLSELQKLNIHTVLVSGIFREKQSFFKWYGGFMRKKLNAFNYFFVQNETSKKLLNSINLKNTTVCGDTRFDRVYDILKQNNTLNFISEFKNNNYTIVTGSSWAEDEECIVNYINNGSSKDEKFIIAPHNINSQDIIALKKSINKKTVLFSEKEEKNLSEYQVFIIDTIGILTKIYSYADVAYIGGGLKTNLHNTLEPAVFGIPLVFGNKKYKKFQEAVDLLSLKGAIGIHNKNDFYTTFTTLKSNNTLRTKMGVINKEYIENNIGATKLIIDYINNTLH